MSELSFDGIEFVESTPRSEDPAKRIEVDEVAPAPKSEPEPKAEASEPEDKAPESVEQAPKEDAEVTEAKSRGWTTKADWIAAGKDPDDWVSAKHFNEKGRLISQARQLDTLQRTFDNRIQNVKVLYDAQLRALRTENDTLQAAKREAIGYADYDAVQRIDKQLMDNAVSQLNVQQASQQAFVDPNVSELQAKEADWNRNNPWINDGSEKSRFAISLYSEMAQNYPQSTFEQRLEVLNEAIKQKYPDAPKTNPNRDKPALTDTKTSSHVSSGKLTWGELTGEELKWFNAMPGAWKSKDEYLQAVTDSRKAGKN